MRAVRLVGFMALGIILSLAVAWMQGRHAHLTPAAVPATPQLVARPAAGPALAPVIQQRDLPPTDIRYDAFALAREEDDLTPAEIFDREPRDPDFAPVMEGRIRAITDLVFPELGVQDKIGPIESECHTLSCVTVIGVPREDAEQLRSDLSGILFGDGQRVTVRNSQDPRMSELVIYNLYRAATRDDAYYKRFLDEGMRPRFEIVKQQRKAHNEARD